MKILYLLEPELEMHDPMFRFGSLKSIVLPEARGLAGLQSDLNGIADSLSVGIILSADVYDRARSSGLDFDGIVPIVFHGDRKSPAEVHRFLCSIVAEFQPDLVLAYENYRHDLTDIFHGCTVIHQMFGPFSRFPFPTFHTYDHIGIHARAGVLAHEAYFAEHVPTEDEIAFFDAFGSRTLSILANYNPYKHYMHELRAQFAKIVMFACQVEGAPPFVKCTHFTTHEAALRDVLMRMPNDCAVLVTQHSYRATFSEEEQQALSEEFSNVRFLGSEMALPDASQYLLPYCDGLITASSALGYQAALYSLPLLLLGKSQLSVLAHARQWDAFESMMHTGLSDAERRRNVSVICYLVIAGGRLFRHNLQSPARYLEFLKQISLDDAISLRPFRSSPEHPEPRDAFNEALASINERAVREASARWANDKRWTCGDILLSEVGNSKVISFDLFDTLIQRPLSKPHLLFRLIEPEAQRIARNSKLPFWSIRRQAEADVRRPTRGNYEITLDQIYSRFQEISGISDHTCSALMELEMEAERLVCQPKKSVIFYLELARRLGRRVGIISDFYIKKEFVADLVTSKGIQSDFLFVSATEGTRKHNGTIFPALIAWARENGFTREDIVHVGDNRVADLEMARANGLRAVWFPQAIENFGRSVLGKNGYRSAHNTDSVPDSILTGMTATRWFSGPYHQVYSDSHIPPHHKALGYAMYGPLLLGFVHWLEQLCRQRGQRAIYFLSRDGYVLEKAFRHLFGDQYDIHYLYASRRSYSVAAAQTVAELVELATVSFNSQRFDDYMMNRFGIELDSSGYRFSARGGIRPNTVVSFPDDLGRIAEWIRSNEELLLAHCSKERSILLKYLSSEGLAPNIDQQPMIVDLGYSGTMQIQLQRLLGQPVFGAYLLTHALATRWLDPTDVAAYIQDFDDHFSKFRNELNDHVFIFEAAFSAPHSTVISFREGEAGAVPVFGEAGVEANNAGFLKQTQAGMLEFVREYAEALDRFGAGLIFSPRLTMAPLLSFATVPAKQDAMLFMGNGVENNFGGGSVLLIHPPSRERVTLEEKNYAVERSKWKPGAQAFYSETHRQQKNHHDNRMQRELAKSNPLGKQVRFRKLGKLKRNPFLFFADSRIATLRMLRVLFAPTAVGRLNASVLRSILSWVRI